MYRNEWIFSTFRADFVWWRQQKYWFDKYSFVKKVYKIVYQNRLSGSRCKISDDEQGIKFINRWKWPVAYISRRRLIAFINHAQPPIARSSALMRDLVGVYICHNVLPHRFAVAPHIRTPCNQNFSIAYLSFRKSVIPWRRVLLSFSLRYYEIFSSHGGEFLIVIRQIRTEDVQKYFIRLLSLSSFILPYFSSTKAMRFRLLAISFLSYDYV